MPDSQPASVSVRDLTRRYGSVEALRSVTFEVWPGEVFGLLGPNGAGKTTALECILGLRRPDSGSILVEGIDAGTRPEEAKRKVGAAIQGATLQDRITPREALGLFAAFYGSNAANVRGLLDRFGIAERADAAFETLSAGQRQRLFLALAFVNNPRIVILDEPTAGLDPRARRELHLLIRETRDSGRAVLLSTHDLEEARLLCDRVALLHEGRLVAAETPAALAERARGRPAFFVRTLPALAEPAVRALAGVASAEVQADGWKLGSNRVNDTLAALARLAEDSHAEILELELIPPSLESAFVALTGGDIPGVPGPRNP